MNEKQKEVFDYISDHYTKFDTCKPYSRSTDLFEDGQDLYVRYLPNCFDCSCDCSPEDEYDDCYELISILILEDGTVSYNDKIVKKNIL